MLEARFIWFNSNSPKFGAKISRFWEKEKFGAKISRFWEKEKFGAKISRFWETNKVFRLILLR
jgi:hypothetical protein